MDGLDELSGERSGERGALRWYGLVVAFYLVVMFVGLGEVRALTRHEVFAAQPAREMLAGVPGAWVVQSFGEVPRYQKPPAMSWMIAGSVAVFGEREWAARLPAVLAGGAVVAGVMAWAWRVMGKEVGIVAGLMQATLMYTVMQARLAEADMPLLAAVTAGMLCLGVAFVPDRFGALPSERARAWLGWGFAACAGVACVIKGVGPVFMVPAALAFAAATRSRAVAWWVLHPGRLGLMLAISAAWPVAAYVHDPRILGQWQAEWGFVAHGKPESGSDPWHFYLWNVPMVLLPWALCLIPAAVAALTGGAVAEEIGSKGGLAAGAGDVGRAALTAGATDEAVVGHGSDEGGSPDRSDGASRGDPRRQAGGRAAGPRGGETPPPPTATRDDTQRFPMTSGSGRGTGEGVVSRGEAVVGGGRWREVLLSPHGLFVVCWLVPGVFLLSLSEVKSKHYALPMLPGVTAVMAWGLLAYLRHQYAQPVRWYGAVIGAWVLGFAGAVTWVLTKRLTEHPANVAIVIGLLGAGGAVVLACEWKRKRAAQLVATFATAGVVLMAVNVLVTPVFDTFGVYRDVARRVNAAVPAGTKVWTVDLGMSQMAWYLRLPVGRVDDRRDEPPAEITTGSWVLMPEQSVKEWESRWSKTTREVLRGGVMGKRIRRDDIIVLVEVVGDARK